MALVLALVASSSTRAARRDGDAFTSAELAAILALGPWPATPAVARDAHGARKPASGDARGIALGEALFHSARLSDAGGVRCASCHEPWRRFTDGRAVALGVAAGTRNTPTLLDVAAHRRFGWDGANDDLAQQSLRPLRDPREMPASAAHVAALLREDGDLRARVTGRRGRRVGHVERGEEGDDVAAFA